MRFYKKVVFLGYIYYLNESLNFLNLSKTFKKKMEEITNSLNFSRRLFLSVNELSTLLRDFAVRLQGWFDNEDLGDLVLFLETDSFFSSYFSFNMDLIHPRPERLTNSDGVIVDPAYVIEKIESAILALNPTVFSAVVINSRIKTRLFEQRTELRPPSEEFPDGIYRGIQSEDFGLTIDFKDERNTIESLLRWGWAKYTRNLDSEFPGMTDEELFIHKMYVKMLVIAYLYYNGLYKKNGVTSLEDFWTSYSRNRRQGELIPHIGDIDWTIRAVTKLYEEGEEPEEEELAFDIDIEGVIPETQHIQAPKPRAEYLSVRVLILRLKTLLALQYEFLAHRIRWQSDPLGPENSIDLFRDKEEQILSDKKKIERDIKAASAILVSDSQATYSDDRQFEALVKWHKIVVTDFAETFSGGITTWESDIPLVYPERTRKAEIDAMYKNFYN